MEKAIRTLLYLPSSILIATDNSCTTAAILKRGSKAPSIQAQVELIFKAARYRNIELTATHVSGHLKFKQLCQYGIRPEIYLFASPINHKLHLFMCPFPHPRAYSTDSFTVDWNKWETIYLFSHQFPAPSNLKPNDVPRDGTNNTSIETDCSLVPCSHTQVLNTLLSRTTLPDRPRRASKHPIHLLRALGRSGFLRAIFRRDYSFPTVKLLAASYRPSSKRQAEVAWRAFKAWLPSSLLSISQSRVLDFLTYLFNIRRLSLPNYYVL